MKNKNEKEKGFYVRANEEGGGDNRSAESHSSSAKSGQKTHTGGRSQGIKKGKAQKKKEGSSRFSAEEISAKETENIEQEDQDDQS